MERRTGMVTGTQKVRQILEDGQQGFAEVVLMMENPVTTAEVYTMYEDLRFRDNIVTFMAEGGSHLHLHMDQIKEVRFIHRMNEQGLPSYSVWFMGEDDQPALRVYLRKSEKAETNQPRHDLFMRLKEKYGETVPIST
jgi:putative heme iron utilization protein